RSRALAADRCGVVTLTGTATRHGCRGARMTNLEKNPPETVLEPGLPCTEVEVLTPREVPLGGIRAMTVYRTLPQKRRSLVGSWCFLDHYGPDDVADTGGMEVPRHPHTGLATVSWLFTGRIDHLDSSDVAAGVVP